MNNQKAKPIIYIEDDEDDRFLFREVFDTLSFPNERIFFNDGIYALEYLMQTSEQPLVIICDINMPLMSGIQLRHEIIKRKNLRICQTPFVFYTTSNGFDSVELAFALNTQGYFQKASSFEKAKADIKLIVDYWAGSISPH